MAYLFILSGVILRIIPHPANFAPIAAIALFGGAKLNKKYALLVPIIAMLIGDIFIGFYNIWIMLSVYGSFLLIGLIGVWLKKHYSWKMTIGGALVSSIIFFLITNFAVWAIPSSFYPHTFQGLINCYIMAIPFFRNTVLGDLFYVGVMFGLYELVINYFSKRGYQSVKPWTKALKNIIR